MRKEKAHAWKNPTPIVVKDIRRFHIENLLHTNYKEDIKEKLHIKKKKLEEEYHISMHSGLEREVDLMCNLSDYVEEQGIQKGIQNVIINLLKLGTVSDEDIMKVGNLSQEELGKLKKELKNGKV